MEALDTVLLLSLLEDTKSHYTTRVEGEEGGSVANTGAHKGDVLVHLHHGDYEGLRVMLLGDVRPLVTSNVIKQVLLAVEAQHYDRALRLLDVITTSELLYVLHEWYRVAVPSYKHQITIQQQHPQLLNWATSGLQDAIDAPMKVVAVPKSMAAEELIDREVESGDELHALLTEIRGGKIPVTYAATYTCMGLEPKSESYSSAQVAEMEVDEVYSLVVGDKMTLVRELVEGCEYYVIGTTAVGHLGVMVERSKKTETPASILVSRLQKCVRYGPESESLLRETVALLATAKDYNLPEQDYKRVSAARQLAWRSFISVMEDVGPVEGCLELLLLSLVAERSNDAVFSSAVLEYVTEVLVGSLWIKQLYPWSSHQPKKSSQSHRPVARACSLALEHVPMMSGDRTMLEHYLGADPDVIPLSQHASTKTTSEVAYDISVRSIDHHCRPALILLYQACKSVGSLTTKQASRAIWDLSSSYNYRRDKHQQARDMDLFGAQAWLYDGAVLPERHHESAMERARKRIGARPTRTQARLAFLLLFGESFTQSRQRMCYAGNEETPLKVMVDGVWSDSAAVPMKTRRVSTKDIAAPEGCGWTKYEYEVSVERGVPYVDGHVLSWYDASCLLVSLDSAYDSPSDDMTADLLSLVLSGAPVSWELYQELLTISTEAGEWVNYATDSDLELLRTIYTRLETQSNDKVVVGPVDRSGAATASAIHPTYEGRLWGSLSLLCYMYPRALEINRGLLSFKVTRGQDYYHVVKSLLTLITLLTPSYSPGTNTPVITSPLWEHQATSVRRLLEAKRQGRHGMGDASSVGAGKTLIALAVAAHLASEQNGKQVGTLVLVPSPALIKTWTDEVKRHTDGFTVVVQQANGKLTRQVPMSSSVLVVSTMGRMRDHPVSNPWKLLVIDECLSVQNSSALQTAEAWRQSTFAGFLLMLSATFFRSRVDKLYYMLKMLRTGLPESKKYLDAILLESIVSQQPETGRVWTVHTHYFTASRELLQLHKEVKASLLTDEVKWSKLNSAVVAEDVTTSLRDLLKATRGKLLIYANSKHEAQRWSETLDIPLYPDISRDSVIVTVSDGARGLNDLVKYDTIVMRPPPPDLLPQIKGRLDRPGQQSKSLSLVYFVLGGTIEEGLLRRLDVASQFASDYIMPLATYYKLALSVE